MSITHHLTDEILTDYAAGALDSSAEVVIACHLTLCSSCRTRASINDSIGGFLLESGENAQTNTTASDIIALDKKDTGSSVAKSGRETHEHPASGGYVASDVPHPLGRLLPTDLSELPWKRMVPGIKQYNLSEKPRKQGSFKLLNLSPGVVLSQHSHTNRELTLVLKGSYQDEIGQFKAGDIADLDAEVEHQPVVDPEESCIVLIATMSPARFTGVLGRMIQPFVGI